LSDQREEGDLGDESAPPKLDRRKLTSGDELVSKGSGDAEQLGGLSDCEDKAVLFAYI
jgi:hypothetical protein